MIYYHFAELIHRQAEKYGNRTALKHRDNATGKWLKISWREFSDKVMLTAKAMAGSGSKHIGYPMIILNVWQVKPNGISGSLQNMRLMESLISLRHR